MVRRDEVRLHAEAEDAQPLVEIVVPDGRVPVGRTAFEHFGAPDVVDEDVDAAEVSPKPLCERLDLRRVEVIDGDGYADAAELVDDVSRLLDGLGALIVGLQRAEAAAPA